MGYFTWTYANQTVRYLKSGDISRHSKVPYGGYGAVLCPDGTLIKEYDYNGYGEFNGKDVYELVVDWNRAYLRDIVAAKLATRDTPTSYQQKYDAVYAELAAAYEDGDWFKCQNIANAFADKEQIYYFHKDWKRSLGIFIACENNENIPYPIKIVDIHYPMRPYDTYPPSIVCQ